MNAQNASHNILVDLDAKRERDLLSNAGTAPSRVAPFHCDNRVNEIFLRALRTRPMPALRRKQQAILPFPQHTVEMQQSGRFQSNSGTENAPRANEKCAQPGDDPICRAQVGRTLAPAIEDQQLLSHQHGLGAERNPPGLASRATVTIK